MTPNRFKFRAWDKKDEQMSSNWCALNILMNEDEKNENKIIMQSTGLLDKNGKELFEGDIVSYATKVKENGKVQYNSDTARFEIFWKHGDILGLDKFWLEHEIEIIGNKFETPELIN